MTWGLAKGNHAGQAESDESHAMRGKLMPGYQQSAVCLRQAMGCQMTRASRHFSLVTDTPSAYRRPPTFSIGACGIHLESARGIRKTVCAPSQSLARGMKGITPPGCMLCPPGRSQLQRQLALPRRNKKQGTASGTRISVSGLVATATGLGTFHGFSRKKVFAKKKPVSKTCAGNSTPHRREVPSSQKPGKWLGYGDDGRAFTAPWGDFNA